MLASDLVFVHVVGESPLRLQAYLTSLNDLGTTDLIVSSLVSLLFLQFQVAQGVAS